MQKAGRLRLHYSRTCLERPPHWPQKCGLSRQVVFGDRFSYIEMQIILPKMHGPSIQVISHVSGLSRQASVYFFSIDGISVKREIVVQVKCLKQQFQKKNSTYCRRRVGLAWWHKLHLVHWIVYLANYGKIVGPRHGPSAEIEVNQKCCYRLQHQLLVLVLCHLFS